MIVVIDTNHLLRLAAAMKRSPLFAAWRNGRFELAISNAILAELESVSQRPKVQRFVPRENLVDLIAFLKTEAIWVILAADFPRCRDPKDDMVTATAIAARADYSVTTDTCGAVLPWRSARRCRFVETFASGVAHPRGGTGQVSGGSALATAIR
jgi:uncharacterized protein